MFDTAELSFALLMKESGNYKLIRYDGWLYLFPVDVDFQLLAQNLNSNKWEQLAVLAIDEDGRVRKSRYGALSP